MDKVVRGKEWFGMRIGKKTKSFVLFLVLCMVLTMLPTTALAAVIPDLSEDWFVKEDTNVTDQQSYDMVCVESGNTLTLACGACLTLSDELWLDGGSFTVEEGASFQAKNIYIDATAEQPVIVSGSSLILYFVDEDDNVVEYPRDENTDQYKFITNEWFYYSVEDENPEKNNKWLWVDQSESLWTIDSKDEVLNAETKAKKSDYVVVQNGKTLTIEAGGSLCAERIYLKNGHLIIEDGAEFIAEEIQTSRQDENNSSITGLTLWQSSWEDSIEKITTNTPVEGIVLSDDTYTFWYDFTFRYDREDERNQWIMTQVHSIPMDLWRAWNSEPLWGVLNQVDAEYTGNTLVDAEKQQLIDFLWNDVQTREDGKYKNVYTTKQSLAESISFYDEFASFIPLEEGKVRYCFFEIKIPNFRWEPLSGIGAVFTLPKDYVLIQNFENEDDDIFLWNYTDPTPIYRLDTDPSHYNVIGADWNQLSIEDGIGKIEIQGQLVEKPTVIEIHDAIRWSLSEDGILTVSGIGNMRDYGFRWKDKEPSWIPYAKDIHTLVIEEGITRIGEEAFLYCDKLDSVTLPEGLKEIGYLAFGGCSSLSKIHLPASLESIDAFSFYLSGIADFEISDSEFLATENGVLYDAKKETLILWPCDKSADSFIVPQGVKTIEKFAFSMSRVKEVTLPEGLMTIEDCAFHSSNLQTIFIPKSVSEINETAFGGLLDQLVIKGYRDSYAKRFANENGYRFVAIDPVNPSSDSSASFVPSTSQPEPTKAEEPKAEDQPWIFAKEPQLLLSEELTNKLIDELALDDETLKSLTVENETLSQSKAEDELVKILEESPILRELLESFIEQDKTKEDSKPDSEKKEKTDQQLLDQVDIHGAVKVEIRLGSENITNFGNEFITVSIPVINTQKLPEHPLVIAISANGKIYYMRGIIKGDTVLVETNHLTTFLVTSLDYEENKKLFEKVEFVAPKTIIPTGTKVDFELEVSGYDLDTITWYTARKNRAVVGKNNGKLVATVTGKTVGSDTIIIKSNDKVIARLDVLVADCSAQFINPVKEMKVGDKLSFELDVKGYEKKDIVWYTKRKNRAVVGKNAGKTKAVVTAKTVGTDTLYVVIDGKTVAETTIRVVEE